MFFQGKWFSSYSINWLNFISWLPLLLEILDNMCIVIVWFPDCDVIDFEINLIFLMKLFFYMTKKSRQNLNILRTKKSCQGEVKCIFHHFKNFSSCQKLSHTWECAFKILSKMILFDLLFDFLGDWNWQDVPLVTVNILLVYHFQNSL